MTDKQQTALQTLIAWGDKMLKDNPSKILSFAEVIDKAQELLPLEQEQIEIAYNQGIEATFQFNYGDGKRYFTDTYKTEP